MECILELNIDFQRVCLGRALEDVVCALDFVEGEIWEERRSRCQPTITESPLVRVICSVSMTQHLPCVTINAAVSSLPTDNKSRMRGIVCVLTRAIDKAVYEERRR